MESTVVAVQGKGTNPKTTLYVGGLEENVTESDLHTTFIAFGEIKDVTIPLDNTTGKHRGFGFVEFEEKVRTMDLGICHCSNMVLGCIQPYSIYYTICFSHFVLARLNILCRFHTISGLFFYIKNLLPSVRKCSIFKDEISNLLPGQNLCNIIFR